MDSLAITTKRLYIRTMTEDDLKIVTELFKEGEIASRHLDDPAFLETLITGEWMEINTDDTCNALIFFRETGRFCGKICLQALHDPTPALGIDLLKAYQNQGIGPEAIVPFLSHCHKIMSIRRVRVRIWKKNAHSIHVFEKMGAIANGAAPYYSPAMLDHMAKTFGDKETEELRIPSVCEYHFDLPI